MRPTPLAASLTLAALVSACGGVSWDRPNTTQSQFEMDAAGCRVQAAQQIQPAYRPEPSVVVVNPRPTPYITTAPTWGPEDANRGVRRDAYMFCMMQKGYRQARS